MTTRMKRAFASGGFFVAAAISGTVLAQDAGLFPDFGTPAWKALFAVDPMDEPLGEAPFDAGAGTRFKTTLKGELAGFDVGRIFLDVTVGEAGYQVGYKMEQRGIARWFSDGEATANASGLFGRGSRIHTSYYYNHDYDGDDDQQRTELYRENDERRLRLWALPGTRFKQPVSEDQAAGALDPLGGLVALAFTPVASGEEPCSRTVRVLDGRRLFDLVMKPAGREYVKKNGKDRFRGDAIKCRLFQEKVAGYKEKNRGDLEGDLWVYLAPVPKDLRTEHLAYVPVKIVGKQGIIGASLQAKRPKLIAEDGTEYKLY